jgi:DNA-directed RNA polymerase specialized sigma24 family protein
MGRSQKLLEAIGHHGEITATMERYRYRHGWQGDRSKAVALAWQVVAPKYFHLSPRVGDIKNDEGQEKLIGVAQGLEDYTNKNTAMVAIEDGFLGKLGAYLKRAAANQETDYRRKQITDGNIILTEARHAEDFHHADREEEEDEEQSDEKILSREKQKHHPSGDPVVEELEAKESSRAWYSTLTERERTAIDLKVTLDNEEEIARIMGISQQRVSQLLGQAFKKWHKFNR